MDCKLANTLLPFAETPQELSAEDRQALEEHLTQCPECGAKISRERAFHGRVARAMLDISIPDGLRAQIHTSLAIDRSRVWRRKLIQTSAAVAAALLIALTAWSWWNRPQSIDLNVIGDREAQQVAPSPEHVSWVMERHGGSMDWPPDFDPNLLRDEQIVDFMGHRVPRLIFLRGEGMAKVYVLKKSQFKMAKDADRSTMASNGCSLEVLETRDYLFVIVYIGDVGRRHFLVQSQTIG
ncbi:MAG TPA: zf-HC2 domain-containing protein [Gemmataceae bacterium]|nr:zf-HC2 domain-containing protein [Gemmataceae bacterium]